MTSPLLPAWCVAVTANCRRCHSCTDRVRRLVLAMKGWACCVLISRNGLLPAVDLAYFHEDVVLECSVLFSLLGRQHLPILNTT